MKQFIFNPMLFQELSQQGNFLDISLDRILIILHTFAEYKMEEELSFFVVKFI